MPRSRRRPSRPREGIPVAPRGCASKLPPLGSMLRARVGRGDAAQDQLPRFRQIQVTATKLDSARSRRRSRSRPARRRGGAPYVPPGNSAATQYTEAVPTAGGRRRPARGSRARTGPRARSSAHTTPKSSTHRARGPRGGRSRRSDGAGDGPRRPAESGGTPNREGSGQGPRTAKPGNGSSGAERDRSHGDPGGKFAARRRARADPRASAR